MIRTTQTATLAAFLLVMPLTAAGAQSKNKCDINDGHPYQVNSARTYLNSARSPSVHADEKPRHLRNGVQVLADNPDKIDNKVGRAWLLGQLLLEWQGLDQTKVTRPRKDVGYNQDPGGTVDMLAAADTAFTEVETLAPECADTAHFFRAHAGNLILKDAVDDFNDGLVDTAAFLARRALVILPDAITAYQVLAQVAQQKQDTRKAIFLLDSAATVSAKDSSPTVSKARKGVLLQAAQLSFNEGLTDTTEAGKQAMMRHSVEDYRRYLKEDPSDANAQAGLARALSQVGDTSAVNEIYAQMLKDPDKYSDTQLSDAGTAALTAKNNKQAIQLLEASLKKNPYSRNALANLAAAYFDAGQAEQMQEIAERLLHVDSLNQDTWRVVVASYQQRVKALSAPADAAKKKVLQDSLIEATRIFTDGLPIQVKVDQFTHQGPRFTATGSVVYTPKQTEAAAAPPAKPCPKGKACPKPTAAPAPAAPGPKTVKVKFEFMDATGKTLVSRTITVGPIDAGSSKDFTINGTQTGVVAYRYDLVE